MLNRSDDGVDEGLWRRVMMFTDVVNDKHRRDVGETIISLDPNLSVTSCFGSSFEHGDAT